jgi:hypothetical protein
LIFTRFGKTAETKQAKMLKWYTSTQHTFALNVTAWCAEVLTGVCDKALKNAQK